MNEIPGFDVRSNFHLSSLPALRATFEDRGHTVSGLHGCFGIHAVLHWKVRIGGFLLENGVHEIAGLNDETHVHLSFWLHSWNCGCSDRRFENGGDDVASFDNNLGHVRAPCRSRAFVGFNSRVAEK